MDKPIIEVNNISKKYTLSHREPYETFRDTITGLAKKPFRLLRGGTKIKKEEFWALKDVSFTVNQGERIGIIGRNGAGKSTLLKILSQITYPNSGQVTLRGRIASLLEVGTGFHPELTGRENIYLNGSILGMKQLEIKKRFEEIVAFSEVEKFLDTPVKRYSSGMYVRLAFAVAAHLEPEILLVDEVLAVGDMQFQKKCLGKMEDVARGGRTILFVSHNMMAIQQLCDRCILLDKGKIIRIGDAQKVIKSYLSSQIKTNSSFEQPADRMKKMNLRKVYLVTEKGVSINHVAYDQDIVIRIEYEVNQKVNNCLVWIFLRTTDGIITLCSADYDLHQQLRGKRLTGYYQTDLTIPKKWLNTGSYDIIVGINSNNSPIEIYDYIETIRFEIIDNGTSPRAIFNESARKGVLQPFLDWKTIKIKNYETN